MIVGRPLRLVLSACALVSCSFALSCGAAKQAGTTGSSSPTSTYVTEPFTHQQRLVEKGAHLVVADGCSACHLSSLGAHIAPAFADLAGHHVELTDGRRVLVDERLVRQALGHPAAFVIKGYDPQSMLQAIRRAHLNSAEIAELAAFVEQVGAE